MSSARTIPLIVAVLSLAIPLLSTAHAQTRVVLETELGAITIEVYEDRAPLSSASFLAYVDAGYYDGAAFYRVVTLENDNGSPLIEVIQGGVTDDARRLPPVEHETTQETGILHEDGVISLARTDPGGLGFAAFGRAVEGMDVVRAIHGRDANGPSEDPYTDGQILTSNVMIVSAERVGSGP